MFCGGGLLIAPRGIKQAINSSIIYNASYLCTAPRILRALPVTTKFTMRNVSHTHSCLSARRCVRRYRRFQRNKAYTRLRSMVPAVAEQKSVSKVTIVEEAVKYIDDLHERFMKRFGNSEDMENIKQMIVTLMSQKAEEDGVEDQPHYSLPVQTPAPKDVLPGDKRAQ